MGPSFAKATVRRIVNLTGYDLAPISKKSQRGPSRDDSADYTRWYGEDAVAKRRFYNVGAGKFRHHIWTNIDHTSEWYGPQQAEGQIEYDLEADNPLPIATGAAAIVYTSHTIEHITDAAAVRLFREARRVLRPGGVFRATTPDIRLAYDAWRRNDRDYFYYEAEMRWKADHWGLMWKSCPADFSAAQMFLRAFAPFLCPAHKLGPANKISDNELERMFRDMPFDDSLNSITSRIDLDEHRAHPNQHVNWWSAEKLIAMLRDAGFSNPYRSGYGQSITPALRDTRLFDNTHPPISLYVEALS